MSVVVAKQLGVNDPFQDVQLALRLASRSPLARCVHHALQQIPDGSTVMVAASGGADSTGLALLATAVASRGEYRVRLVTIDHGLRSDSALDAAFVQALGAWLGVPVDRCRVQVAPGAGIAAKARRARHAAIIRAAAQANASAVLMAHHAEDQLETMLMRLVRGSGAQAAAGMRASRTMRESLLLLRPLLERSRDEIRTLLVDAKVPWREDPSNQDRSRPRGRLRHEVLPVLEAMRPGAAMRASRTARRLQGAAKALAAQAKKILQGDGPWARASLRRAPREALALALRKLEKHAAEVGIERAVEAIRSADVKPKRCMLGARELRVQAKWVRWHCAYTQQSE